MNKANKTVQILSEHQLAYENVEDGQHFVVCLCEIKIFIGKVYLLQNAYLGIALHQMSELKEASVI